MSTHQHTPGPIQTVTTRYARLALSPLALAALTLASLAILLMVFGYGIRLALATAAGQHLTPLPTAATIALSYSAAALTIPALAAQLHALRNPAAPALRPHHAATIATLIALDTALIIPHTEPLAWAALAALALAATLPLITAPRTRPRLTRTDFTPVSLTGAALLTMTSLFLTPTQAPLLIATAAAAHLLTQAEWTPTTQHRTTTPDHAPASARSEATRHRAHAQHL